MFGDSSSWGMDVVGILITEDGAVRHIGLWYLEYIAKLSEIRLNKIIQIFANGRNW